MVLATMNDAEITRLVHALMLLSLVLALTVAAAT
jgi:hypothetical protein